jgi:hypothetical protein
MTGLTGLCSWTDSDWGKSAIAGALFLTGANFMGWLPAGVTDFGWGMVTVGNAVGIVSLVGGVCLLYNVVSPTARLESFAAEYNAIENMLA